MNRKIRRSFYVLDVEPGATPDQTKQAYLTLVKIWHPDRFANDPDLTRKASEKMKEINQAYDEVKAWQSARARSAPRHSRADADSRDTETYEAEEFQRSRRAARGGFATNVSGTIRNRVILMLALGASIVVSFYLISDSVREWAATPPPQFAGQAEYNQTREAVFQKTRAAAERGERFAQANLAFMYFDGRGAATNKLEAVRWHRRAAEQGEVSSQVALGRCLYSGDGVPLDYAAAAYWFQRAAEQGDAESQERLGQCYARGEGAATDLPHAYYWLAAAAAQGRATAATARDDVFLRMTRAQQETAQRLVTERTVARAAKSATNDLAKFRAAAEKGDRAAQNQLGVAFQTGSGVPQNLAEAARWYRLAAEQGDAYAQANLAGLCAAGQGVETDFIEAYKWWNLASAQGHRTAAASRDSLAARMSAEQILDAQRRSTEFIQRKLQR
ncbi:MAG: SEL1-like repeat protein [Verrucomicrobia bacterium]|nr:SEL1-like repeat protein [Verrucomicrobiota bacterium]